MTTFPSPSASPDPSPSTIEAIAHLGLAVPDADRAADDLVRRFGFVRDGRPADPRPGEVTYALRRGRASLLVSAPGPAEAGARTADIPVPADPAATAPAGTNQPPTDPASADLSPATGAGPFVAAHGSGVRDIAFLVPDAAAAWRTAVARGAQPAGTGPQHDGQPGQSRYAISVFGAYEHTFVDAPAQRREQPTPTGRQPDVLDHLDHLALAVPYGQLDQWADFYVEALAFEIIMKETTDTGRSSMRSTVVREAASGVTFTLVEPGTAEGTDQINDFLRHNRGPGVQHIALGTADILATVDEWTAAGVRFLSVPGSYYDVLAERVPAIAPEVEGLRAHSVLADSDEKGELLQIFTEPVFERPTAFFELIERRGGSSGFGSGNIKALFRAVEEEQHRRSTR